MGREGMKPGPHRAWTDPSVIRKMEKEEAPWPDQIERAENGELVGRILEDIKIIDDIERADFPVDEETCDEIAEKHGTGAAEIAVLSRRLRERVEKKAH